LGGFQIAISCFGGVPSGVDFGFRPLAFGDVTVDQYEPAVWHRVAANLDDTPIWSCAFKPQFLMSVFEATAEFRLDVFRPEFATCCKYANLIGITRTLH
jgi:hypothetical protein